MDDADHARLPAGLDRHLGADHRGRGGDRAEERQGYIAQSLSDELLIHLQADAGHIGTGRAAEECFNGAQRGERQRGRDEIGKMTSTGYW